MTILLFVLQWLVVIILLAVLILMFLWMANLTRDGVPFIPISKSVIKEVEKVIGINDNSVVYDLGCGDGRVLFYLSKLHPKAKFIGIERSPFPLLLSKVTAFFYNKKVENKIEIINKDFFNTDLSNATHIFTYLKPKEMDDLLTKLDKELKNGTKLVSAYFQFTLKRPIAEIRISKNLNDVNKKLYIYEF